MTEPTAEDLLGLPPKNDRTIKCCKTCYHRNISGFCDRVSYFCTTEVSYGGRCVQGNEYLLWEPRLNILQRAFEWITKL